MYVCSALPPSKRNACSQTSATAHPPSSQANVAHQGAALLLLVKQARQGKAQQRGQRQQPVCQQSEGQAPGQARAACDAVWRRGRG